MKSLLGSSQTKNMLTYLRLMLWDLLSLLCIGVLCKKETTASTGSRWGLQPQERKKSLRNCPGEHVKCMLKVSGSILNSSSCQGNQVEKDVALKLYKPSEFETSVLKFSEDTPVSNPSKRQRTLQPIIQERDQVQCLVNFRNPLKIENVKNVKIVMYENLSSCSELLLKQLQDMQPMVILDKGLHSWWLD